MSMGHESILERPYFQCGHLSRIFDKARSSKRRPVWIKEKIWTDLWIYWASPEFQQKSERNKLNRAKAKEKGIPPYRGGSVCTSVHKDRMIGEDGLPPSPRKLFTRCHKKKDGTMSESCQQYVDNYDKLLEQATQEAQDSEGPCVIDKNLIWIKAVGGANKGRILGMGSEAEPILKKTRYTSLGACGPSEASAFVREDMMTEISNLKAQISQGMTSLTEKMTNLEQNQVEIRQDVTNLGDVVQLNQEQVRKDLADVEEHVDRSVASVRTETRLNHEVLQKDIEQTIIGSIAKFFVGQRQPSS